MACPLKFPDDLYGNNLPQKQTKAKNHPRAQRAVGCLPEGTLYTFAGP